MGPTQPEAISAVPSISLSNLDERKAPISAELMAAATKVGFLYVTGEARAPAVVTFWCSSGLS